jgi:hypothetical protein
MSGRPNTAQVEELRLELLTKRAAALEIEHIKARQESLRLELENASQRHRAANVRILDLLHKMDCYGSGNAGWEARLEVLLTLMAERHKPEAGA